LSLAQHHDGVARLPILAKLQGRQSGDPRLVVVIDGVSIGLCLSGVDRDQRAWFDGFNISAEHVLRHFAAHRIQLEADGNLFAGGRSQG
jgi:hypothetical protein